MNVLDFADRKGGKKISMVTCYDYTFARVLNSSMIDCILVGDSAAMTMHGHPTTLSINIQTMAEHVASVVRGAPTKFIIGDLPFMSYRKGLNQSMTNVELLMKAGAHSVKLEGAEGNDKLIRHIVHSGVPVMGHLGLTPQSIHQLGGFKVQGRGEAAAKRLIQDAQVLQDSGCFSIVLECVPADLAAKITKLLSIPTIGIGAGAETDGQVLVLQDLLGLNTEFKPKFVRNFADVHAKSLDAFNEFHNQVQALEFPSAAESFKAKS